MQTGALSVINSVYDPLGFVSPVFLEGKLIPTATRHHGEEGEWERSPWLG